MMQYKGMTTAYYSIGRFYSKPDVPNKTYIFGAGFKDITEADFIKQFKETFRFKGTVKLKELGDPQIIEVEGTKWPITLDKQIYIVVGK